MTTFEDSFRRAQWAYDNMLPPEGIEYGLCECGEYHHVDDGCDDFRHDPDAEAEDRADAEAERRIEAAMDAAADYDAEGGPYGRE